MAEKHSGWSRTSRGARASSQGAPRTTRTDGGARVDLDGVPLKYTTGSGVSLPDEFYAQFREDPDAAYAKWTADGA